jgi:hypothetical protein
VFEANDSRQASWVPNKKQTVIDTLLEPTRWFDVTDSDKTEFHFDCIIIYPEEVSQSTYTTMFVAAAALKEDPTEVSHQPHVIEGQSVDLVRKYQ